MFINTIDASALWRTSYPDDIYWTCASPKRLKFEEMNKYIISLLRVSWSSYNELCWEQINSWNFKAHMNWLWIADVIAADDGEQCLKDHSWAPYPSTLPCHPWETSGESCCWLAWLSGNTSGNGEVEIQTWKIIVFFFLVVLLNSEALLKNLLQVHMTSK